ncbi:MAG: hypothetical protein QNJ09_10205 [Paracoccaceae bacterium]|nr:hypothetical protein [Paracoccaceae bacterium]
MKGWRIFTHSVRLVLNNLEAALRVSAVLYLPQVALQYMIYQNPQLSGDMGDVPAEFDPGDVGLFGNFFLLSFLALIASLWIAVAWHRYVLENEAPPGWVPRWHGSQMLGYLGRSILVGLIIVAAILVMSIPVGFLSLGLPGLTGFFLLGMVGLAAYIFFRLGVVLPAIAIGKQMKIGEAWRATKDDDNAVVMLALLVIAASVVMQLPSMIGGQGTFIDFVYQVVVGWFATIIGISVLTTLFGHYVEGRPID